LRGFQVLPGDIGSRRQPHLVKNRLLFQCGVKKALV
jgi:hypothetical protein